MEQQPRPWWEGPLGISLLLLGLLLSRPDPVQSELASGGHDPQLQNVTLAVILPLSNTDYPWAWPRVGPAIQRAVERINADSSLLPGCRIQLVYDSSENKDGFCSDSVAPLVAVDLKFSHDPWAFVGPGCDYASSPVARFTTHWDVPMVTGGAPAIGFKSYPSITNTGPTHKKLGEFVVLLHRYFGWHRHALLMFCDNKEDDRPCYFTVEGLYTELQEANITTSDMVFSEQADKVKYPDLIHDISQKARVVYVCCSKDTFRKLMVQFWREGLKGEDYVFFFMDLFGRSLDDHPARPWYRGDEDDEAAKEAFRSAKILTYREPQNPEYQQFVSHLKTDAWNTFNLTINDSLINVIAGAFHDGVMLYSQALNEILEESGGVRPPGDTVTKRMWNRTYHGVTGVVDIDEKGDREIDFALWDMTDVDTGVFQIVLVYNSSVKQLGMEPGMAVQWPGGSAPQDIPDCGFKNDNVACLARTVTVHQMVAVVVCFIFVIIVTVTVFIYREVTARPRTGQKTGCLCH